MSSPLDPFLPIFDAREHFEVRVQAPAALTFATAAAFDLQSLWPIRAIFRLRELLLRSRNPRPPSLGILTELPAFGWGQLALEPDHLFVAGAFCQPWLADVHFTPLDAQTFPLFREPGYVKIAWTLEVDPVTEHTCVLRTETRAAATDSQTQVRFKAYWRWARLGILPIRWFLLPAIRRAAEARTRRASMY
ncbi:MAG: hypothetical protein EPO35_02070 [Acidobacteria bacterium]|nr:MAG: hypothetical protein EPO35_02070 [Acidobacteriota bacterium]